MHKRIKLLLTALIAAIACSLAASSASANRSIEIRGGEGTVRASARLQFIGTEGETGREITCDVTLLRTITSLIPKIRGTLFGKVTGVRIDRGETTRSPHCRHGSLVREVHDIVPLPCVHSEDGRGNLLWDCSRAEARLWKLIYDVFQGTLPRIEGINFHIQRTQFRFRLLEPFGGTIQCLYEGEAFGLITVNQPENTITRAETRKRFSSIPRIEGSTICPAFATFEGGFNVTPTLTIALI